MYSKGRRTTPLKASRPFSKEWTSRHAFSRWHTATSSQWHYHSEVTDHFFVLSGTLTIETRTPEDRLTVAVGERYQITAANPHTVSNRGPTDCLFLLLQGVGRYDWKSAGL